jgi:hypothetical protein
LRKVGFTVKGSSKQGAKALGNALAGSFLGGTGEPSGLAGWYKSLEVCAVRGFAPRPAHLGIYPEVGME